MMFSMVMDDDIRRKLNELAEDHKVTSSEMVRRLVLECWSRGLPSGADWDEARPEGGETDGE
jgi:predicted transcriptional regulator